MAVSQFLRPGSLMDAVKGQLTPDVLKSASSLVGESESSTRQALNGAVPSVMTGLTNLASSRDGANNLAGLIRDGGYGAVVDNVRSLFSGGSATTNMLSAAPQLLGTIFGGRSAAVADLIGKSSGVSSGSATKLLSLAAPLVLGVLGKRASAQGLNSSGLANALLSEKSDIAAAAPAGLSQLLSTGPVAVDRTLERKEVPATTGARVSEPLHIEHFSEPAPVVDEPRGGGVRWLPLALAALAALALLMFLRGRTTRSVQNIPTQAVDATKEAMSKVELPGGSNISVPQGSINYNLARFLGDPSATGLPKNFVFDHLNFQTASTQLTPESVPTVNDLAQVLKAYPNSQVQLVGHTDSTGTAEANQTLSLDRANAVKSVLVAQGVGADRIATTGSGQDQPVASNDTEQGRARNRRLELNVTRK
jgi:outer membrane protein OmpA-like peptidoglycan-associated protein